MRLAELTRNCIESTPALSRSYDLIAFTPPYRQLVLRRARQSIASIRAAQAYRLLIEVSSLCNARCVFCPNAALKRPRQLMSDETFDLIIRRLLAEGIQPPIIDLFDVGEPLLDPHLFDKVGCLRPLFPDAVIEFTTNFALATTESIDEILSSGLDAVNISLNAARPETYHSIMGLHYQRTVQNIDRLLERRSATGSKLRISLSMVICQDNAAEAGAFDRAWRGKVDGISLNRAHDWADNVALPSPYPARKPLFPCHELFDRIVILSNGDAAICCADAEGQTGMNIHDHALLDIFYAPVFEDLRTRHLANGIAHIPMCRDCFGVNSNGAVWLLTKAARPQLANSRLTTS